MNEKWKPVVGYEGFYEVSDTGKIKTLGRTIQQKDGRTRTIKSKVMKDRTNNRGYHIISLNTGNSKKDHLVHRLVAMAFLPNPDNLEQVNHIDGNKDNNSVSNLEWCDQTHNMKEAYKLGLRKATLPVWDDELRAKFSAIKKGTRNYSQMKKVIQYSLEGEYIACYRNAEDAAKAIGIKDKTGIYDVCTGRKNRKQCGGYKWKYAKRRKGNNGKVQRLSKPSGSRVHSSEWKWSGPFEI